MAHEWLCFLSLFTRNIHSPAQKRMTTILTTTQSWHHDQVTVLITFLTSWPPSPNIQSTPLHLTFSECFSRQNPALSHSLPPHCSLGCPCALTCPCVQFHHDQAPVLKCILFSQTPLWYPRLLPLQRHLIP